MSLIFYWAYRQWLSWLVLMAVVWTPWLSLLVSLPAMLCCRMQAVCPTRLTAGEGASLALSCRNPFPIPAVRGRVLVQRRLTGQHWKLTNGDRLPTDHCGTLTVNLKRAWCYDYLGLFRFPVRRREHGVLTVLPRPVAVEPLPDITRYMANGWRPKAGGGFAENHELRLYRPGDSLRQVHWKLSAKTGKLVYREPMEALRGRAVITARLSGSPGALDVKLGKLRYISAFLLQNDISHTLVCLTGDGPVEQVVTKEEDLIPALTRILACPPAGSDMELGFVPAAWRYHVGGDGDEA